MQKKVSDTLSQKGKIIQTITAWRYPCQQIFYFIEDIEGNKVLEADYRIGKRRKDLREICPCGKGCKPEKVKIVVIKEEQ